MSTLIPIDQLRVLIQLSGEAIRDFLQSADEGQFSGEPLDAIKAFKFNPAKFVDEQLVALGEDRMQAIHHSVRMEVRSVSFQGASQLVAKGIWGAERLCATKVIEAECQRRGFAVHLKLAGSSSFEFNATGVDKALPIRFLQTSFDKVLSQMNYTAGTCIDARKKKTVFACDGDGTLYGGPSLGVLPQLVQSPARDALMTFLDKGGVFMLISGNDLDRSWARLKSGIDPRFFNRVLVAANGGANLSFVTAKGELQAINEYCEHALSLTENVLNIRPLDIYYAGDDGSYEGNDYPAFKAVGSDRALLVAQRFLSEYDILLKSGYVGLGLEGTKSILEKLSAKLSVFEPDEPYGANSCAG